MIDAPLACRDNLRWVDLVLTSFRRCAPSGAVGRPKQHISGLPYLAAIAPQAVRPFVQAYGNEFGLHGLHDFVRQALVFPDPLTARIQSLGQLALPTPERERLEMFVQAFGMAIVRDHRMSSYFHTLVREFFQLGEQNLAGVANLLAAIAGRDATAKKLYRKLSTPDAELREYVLYLLGEFGASACFSEYVPKLQRLYRAERDNYVKEAFEHVLKFGSP